MTDKLTLDTPLKEVGIMDNEELKNALSTPEPVLADMIGKVAVSHFLSLHHHIEVSKFTDPFSLIKIVDELEKSELFSDEMISFMRKYVDEDFDKVARDYIGGKIWSRGGKDGIPVQNAYVLAQSVLREMRRQARQKSDTDGNIGDENIDNQNKFLKELKSYIEGLHKLALEMTINDPLFKDLDMESIIYGTPETHSFPSSGPLAKLPEWIRIIVVQYHFENSKK